MKSQTRRPDQDQAAGCGRAFARSLTLPVVVMLASCASAPPTAQITYFSRAFDTVNSVGQPLLDDLAVAERTQGRAQAAKSARDDSKIAPPIDCPRNEVKWQAIPVSSTEGFINGFCLSDAAYFSALGDPPATRRFRGGLAVIQQYADVLSALAENRNVEGALKQVDMLGRNIEGLLDVAGIAAGPIGPVLAALQKILRNAAAQANAQEARRLILEGAPQVTHLIDALRKAAPAMFNVLVESAGRQAVEAEQRAMADTEIARIEAYRIAVSNYVLLLGKLQVSWDLTFAAANAPQGQGNLATLIEQTSALRANAESARRVFAALRSGAVAAQSIAPL